MSHLISSKWMDDIFHQLVVVVEVIHESPRDLAVVALRVVDG
jgi:hypothetical protein